MADREDELEDWYYHALVDTFVERLGRERALVMELTATVARMGCSPTVGAQGDGGVGG
jgi:hypothetical protein